MAADWVHRQPPPKRRGHVSGNAKGIWAEPTSCALSKRRRASASQRNFTTLRSPSVRGLVPKKSGLTRFDPVGPKGQNQKGATPTELLRLHTVHDGAEIPANFGNGQRLHGGSLADDAKFCKARHLDRSLERIWTPWLSNASGCFPTRPRPAEKGRAPAPFRTGVRRARW